VRIVTNAIKNTLWRYEEKAVWIHRTQKALVCKERLESVIFEPKYLQYH